MTVHEAIQEAERVLPGVASPEGERGPRWQAIIHVGYFIGTDPDAVWAFVEKWGSHQDEDLRTAIATCLLEHLLGEHFADYFGKVEDAVHGSPIFGDTFSRCWKFDQAEQPENAKRWDKLLNESRGRLR